MEDRFLNIIDKLNTRWQPAITSTPLKPKSTKWENKSIKNAGLTKSDNLLNSILNHYQNVNTDKKSNKTFRKNLKKSKQSFHFDESSSSADEDVTKTSTQDLEVKINVQSNSRIREKEIDIRFEKATNSSFKDVKSKQKISSNSKKINKKNNALTQNQKNLFQGKIEVPPLVNVKENSKILKKVGKKKKSTEVNEKNLIASTSVENVHNTSVKNIKNVSSEGLLSAPNNSEIIIDACKLVKDQFLKNTEKLKIADNKKLGEEDEVIFKTPLKLSPITKNINTDIAKKRRGAKLLNSNVPKKKVKKKQLQNNGQNSIENYLKSPSLECEKKNLSHQLFSESREQELINSLNLTLQEDSPLVQKNMNNSQHLENKVKLHKCHEIGLDKDFKVLKIKKKVTLQNENIDYDLNNKNAGTENENHKEQLVTNNLMQFEPPLSLITSQNPENIQNNELNSDEENCRKNLRSTTKNKNCNLKKKKSYEVSEKKKLFEEKHKNTDNKAICEKKTEALSKFSSIQDVFKITNQLTSFTENQPGCFTAECWSLNKFKCGILKLKSKSKIGSKTAYDNSYFGGVVLTGSLKFYIGEQKLELQEGGMAFVPPLTDWMVKNLLKTEAIMYYWFGRFSS